MSYPEGMRYWESMVNFAIMGDDVWKDRNSFEGRMWAWMLESLVKAVRIILLRNYTEQSLKLGQKTRSEMCSRTDRVVEIREGPQPHIHNQGYFRA